MNLALIWATIVCVQLKLIPRSETFTINGTRGLKNTLPQNPKISRELNGKKAVTTTELPPIHRLLQLLEAVKKVNEVTVNQNMSLIPQESSEEKSCEWKVEYEQTCQLSVGALCGPGVLLRREHCVCSNRPASEQECQESQKSKNSQECYLDCKQSDVMIFSIIILFIIFITALLIAYAYKRFQHDSLETNDSIPLTTATAHGNLFDDVMYIGEIPG